MDIEGDRLIFGIIISYILMALIQNRSGWSSIKPDELIYPNTYAPLPDTIPNLSLR
jgi:hypothetical protein